MPRKNSIISVSHNTETNDLTFAVGDAGTFTIAVASLPEEIRNRAMLHGIVQKVSDAAAMPKSELTGDAAKDATAKFDAMSAVAERLNNGDWSRRSSDGTGPVAGIIFRAFEAWVLENVKKGKTAPTHEAIRAKYDSFDRAGQLALKKVPRISEIMETLRAEKSTSTVDTDVLLSDILG